MYRFLPLSLTFCALCPVFFPAAANSQTAAKRVAVKASLPSPTPALVPAAPVPTSTAPDKVLGDAFAKSALKALIVMKSDNVTRHDVQAAVNDAKAEAETDAEVNMSMQLGTLFVVEESMSSVLDIKHMDYAAKNYPTVQELQDAYHADPTVVELNRRTQDCENAMTAALRARTWADANKECSGEEMKALLKTR